MTRNPIRWVRQTSGILWKTRLRHHVNIVRWMLDRCDGCGHRFAWTGDARFGQNSQTFHEPCLGWKTWRATAEERMQVLELVCDVWGVKADDVRELMANRAEREGYERSNAWNLAWRVFYQLEQRPKKPLSRPGASSDHGFQPVAGHPDDDECTHRPDGTDATYCGRPRGEH